MLLQPEVAQNLARQLVVAQIGFEAQPLVGFHGVGALILQFVGAQLVQQADAAPFLMLVDQQAAAFVGDRLQRQFKLRAAIAAQAVEDVAGQALRNGCAPAAAADRRQIAHLQHHRFFHAIRPDGLRIRRSESVRTGLENPLRQLCAAGARKECA